LKDANGDDKRGNKTMMRKQDNHHITYKEKTMVSRVWRVIQGVKNDDKEVGQVKGLLGRKNFLF